VSDEDRLITLESELAETRRKLAEAEQHLASANQIIGSYSTVRCGLVKGHTDPRCDAMAEHLKREIVEKESARAQLAIARTPTDDVWMWQGGGDEPEGLSCPVVMSAETLRALLARTAEAIMAERSASLGELKRRADWLAHECSKGGTCFAERDEAYTAVKTLEHFYAHGRVRRIGERADDANAIADAAHPEVREE
jgi:hypothetical protein